MVSVTGSMCSVSHYLVDPRHQPFREHPINGSQRAQRRHRDHGGVRNIADKKLLSPNFRSLQEPSRALCYLRKRKNTILAAPQCLTYY